jgi:hypothetical protein
LKRAATEVVALAKSLEVQVMFKHLVVFALAVASPAALAQSPAANTAQPTPQDYAQRNQQLERAALQVAGMVDQNQTAQVWDGASPVARQLETLDVFVRGVSTDRQKVGAPVARSFASLSFSQSDGKRVPAGVFANVAFATRFANEKQLVRELISFHLDSDHVWRVTGYTLR